jgi:zinc transport system permease protein
MVISLLTLPPMTANLFTHRFSNIIVGAIGIGWISCTGGLLLSYQLQVPSGASIIFFSIFVYALCKIGKSLYICKRSKQ